MTQTRKSYARQHASLRLRLQAVDPEIDAYIASVKKKYQKYAMPVDEVRRLVDSQMGKRTLTEFLYEARE